ncbi:hypothetical protein D3C80_1050810 [compost metagenome]
MVDGFLERHFVTRLQRSVVGSDAAVGTQHIANFTAENTALVILITQFNAGFRQVGFQLAVGVLNHFTHPLFDQFAGVPGSPGPCRAKNHNDANSD